ncbi:DMT family transporter [Burkholderiaceae bacterium]|nr:DMT family transporter [Burkholderiaceae bacterium]
MRNNAGLWLAAAAVALWAILAPLGVALQHVPPLLLTGLSLLVGGLVALPFNGLHVSAWRVSWRSLALGVYGLFGFHFLLFMSLRLAPPVAANLVNYLWPLGIVVMAPLFLPSVKWRWLYALAAVLGFGGAGIAILSNGSNGSVTNTHHPQALVGYALAFGSAWIWSSYSLLSKRATHLKPGAIGSFCLVSGALSLCAHSVLEPTTVLAAQDLFLIGLLGLGPLGGAFYLWHIALRSADARQVGLLAFATPLLSTILLLLQNNQALQLPIAVATVLIISGAWIGTRVTD